MSPPGRPRTRAATRPSVRGQRATLGALLATAVAVAACAGPARQESGDGPGRSDTTAAATPEPAAPAGTAPVDTTPADTLPADFAGTTGPVSGGDDTPDGVATLTAVRTAPRPALGVERVVFELDGATLPAYRVEYVEGPATQCGSGRSVPLAGDAVLVVRLHHTRAHAEREGALVPTVTDRDRTLAQPVMKQLTLTCDFEGETTWALGLAGRRPFRVLELRAPTRLVVDVRGDQPARAEVR